MNLIFWALKHLWAVQTKAHRPVRLIDLTLILNAERKLFRLMIWKKARSSFDVIVFNWCPRNLWVRMLLSRTRCKIFRSTFDTPVILDISLWKSPRPENCTMFSIIAGRILVSMIASLSWNGNLHTMTAYNWMWSAQMRHTDFWCNCGNQHFWKRWLTGQDKSDGWPQMFVRGWWKVL